jgi:hypothetical protein
MFLSVKPRGSSVKNYQSEMDFYVLARPSSRPFFAPMIIWQYKKVHFSKTRGPYYPCTQ